jgi:hypothetical protein
MNPTYRHHHNPPPRVSTRVRCPVCHNEVYSRAGIHPQCAARESEPHKVMSRKRKSGSGAKPVTGPIAAVAVVLPLEPPAALRIFDPEGIPA